MLLPKKHNCAMRYSNINIPNVPVKEVPAEMRDCFKLSKRLACRDPFIMPCGGKYYLYHTLGKEGIGCKVSEDLENWSAPITVFTPPEDFHGVDCFFWAPECHYYKGNFYIFTSVLSLKYNNHRTISVYRSASPLGPFEDIADGAISPADWDAIDGTLYVDNNGDPWLVFVHEWTSMPDKNGSMVAARLSEDFTKLISEPQHLFFAKEPEWARSGVTDGPFLVTTDAGTLYMLWSNFEKDGGYVVALARSESGNILGPWKHCKKLIYNSKMAADGYDGGHAMIFRTKEGRDMISFHGPNNSKIAEEHVHLLPIVVKDDILTLEI